MAASGTESGFAAIQIKGTEQSIRQAASLDYSGVLSDLRAVFKTGRTKDLAWRKRQLESMMRLIEENHEVLTTAVRADLGGAKLRGLAELGSHANAQMAIKNLDSWAADEKVGHDSLFGSSYVRNEPKGVVLIISPWNYPIQLALDCMVGVLAAGNCMVLKPSEMSANCSTLLAELIPQYFDPECIKVELGAVAETTALLREKWDHILYTGNGAVGRIVLQAAAKHLTPCTLELGGKSPVYVDKSASLDTCVTRLNVWKFLNAGQTCIAPDYILVHKDVAEAFIEKLKAKVERSYGGKNAGIDQYGRIINGRHVQRVGNMVESSTGTVISGGKVDVGDCFVSPTLIKDPGLGDAVMQQEIFGPVLPIIAVESVEEAIEKMNEVCATPLALYVFSEDSKVNEQVMGNTTSGGVVINGAMEHFGNSNLPFGGVGDSGMGAYHGKWGFDEFTHKRAVMVKDTTFVKGTWVPPPPYKDKIYDMAVKLQITGFLTPGQRTAVKVGGAALVAFVCDRVFGIRKKLSKL